MIKFRIRPFWKLCFAVVTILGSSPWIRAHNLDQRFTYISYSTETLDMMRQRAAAGLPAIIPTDVIAFDLKSTPGPGTATGVGGYLTFYLPTDNTFQVVGASYLIPDPDRSGYFMPAPIKGQSIIAVGSGPIGAATSTGLTGLTLGPNINGVTETATTAAGVHRGTIAGVYADTGIFYSTSPKTAWESWQNGTRPTMQGGGQYPVYLTNNRGESIRPRTYWDASQLIGFGLSSPHSPATDPNGRGSSPWGTANVVAGPQSGYAWDFDLDQWVSSGFPGYTSSTLMSTLDQVGPWQRIKYPGSQVSKDRAGLISAELGYAGVDASNLGLALSESSPLPGNTTAVRFSVGMLELGRTEAARVYVKVNQMFANCPFPIHGDAFGGDAGGEQGGKDHLWRYYDPTDEVINLCAGLTKSFSRDLVAPGSTVTCTLTFPNLSSHPVSNLVITDPLPSGISYVAATSKLNGVAVTPAATAPMTWNIGYVAPYSMATVTFDVLVSGAGTFLNTATATSSAGTVDASDSIRSAYDEVLHWDKTVTPSSVAPGQSVTYTITIDNDGTGVNGVPFVITEYLPAGFTYQSVVTKQINGALLPDSLFSVSAINPNQPVFTVSQGIAAGKSLVLTFKALVGASVSPGTYYNSYKMTYEGKALASPPDAPVNVGGGKIGDTVWRDWDGDGTQDVGEEGIQGISISLYRDVNNDNVYDAGDTLLATQVTDSGGHYNFEGLPDGEYIVKVDTSAAGLAQHANTADPDGGTLSQAAVTLAGNSGTDLIDFGYRPGGASLGTASIGDKVFEDKDNNGTFNGADAGINNVTVNLYEDTNGNGVIDTGDLLITTQVTSGSGDYLFSNLATGRNYLVDVVESDPDLAAYFAALGKSYFPSTAGQFAVPAPTGAVLDKDFGFQGASPASVGDTVFFDSNANGVYDLGTDTPLPGVTVSLYFDANGDGVAQSGELVSSKSTDGAGQYIFAGIAPDRYIVVVDVNDPQVPSGAIPVVPQYLVTLTNGQNYLAADFPFVNIFTKTADKSSALPGDIITYNINLNLPGNTLYQNLVITDPLPSSDLTLVSASAGGVINGGYTPDAPVNGSRALVNSTVLDQFAANNYTGSNGTASWASNWVETNDDGVATTGGILAAGNLLRFNFNVVASSDGDYIERGINLSEAGSASLTYSLVTNELDTGEFIYVEVKGGGTNWVLVDTITLGTATGAKGGFDLKAILQAASPVQSMVNPTAIRFRRGVGTGNDQIEFDNIQIAYATPSTTTAIAVSPIQVNDDGTATVTMTVGSSVAMTGVTPGALTPTLSGGATATLLTGPSPASASISAGGTTTFTWTYRLNDGAAPAGTVKFTGTPTGTITGGTSYAFASAISGSSQVIPAGPGTVSWNLGSHTQSIDGLRIAGAGLYAFRGAGTATFMKYDLATSAWSDAAAGDYGANVGLGGSLTTDGTSIFGLQGNNTKIFKSYVPEVWGGTARTSTTAAIKGGGSLAYYAANGKIYALTGNNSKTFYEYTIGSPGTWTAKAPLATAVNPGGALVSSGSYLYAFVGNNKTLFYRYDPAANTWATMATTPGGVGLGGSLVAVGNYLYAFQGKVATFWRYDIAANTWSTMTAAPAAVGDGAALVAVGNTIYALRGNGAGTDTEFWRYNITTNAWTVDTSTPLAIGSGGALLKFGTSRTYETAVAVSPSIVTSGQTVTATYTVTADENVTGFTPPATLTAASVGGATATYVGGPSPSGSTSLTANVPKTFTYTYTLGAGTPPSGVTFSVPQFTSGTSTALPGGVVWPLATCHNVITVPTLTMQAKVIASPAGDLTNNIASFGGSQTNNLDYCYVLADGSGSDTDTDVLLKITQDGTVTRIGTTGTTFGESLVFSPDRTILYTTDRDAATAAGSDRFGTLNLTTGLFTPISRLASGSNLLEGFLPGNIATNFSVLDVDGMSFDPVSGKLYAIDRREDASTANTLIDLLFVINPVTGQHVEDAFGPGKDYIAIRTDLMTTPLYDIDDIAFRPGTGELYAIANDTATGSGEGDHLVKINITTGLVTDVARIQRSTDNANIDDVEGLTFSSNGSLHATTGEASTAGILNSYWIIDPTTAKASLTGLSNLNPISDGGAPVFDFEGVACFSDDLPIAATDHAITTLKGAIGDLVWADLNGDGNYDPTYAIVGGKININDSNGVIDANDDGVIGSYRIIDGMIDLSGDGTIDAADDGTFQGIAVVDGVLQSGTNLVAETGISNVRVYVDANNNGNYDATFNVIGGKVDLNGNGSIDTSGSTDSAWVDGTQIIKGMIDINSDGLTNSSDDGTFGGATVVDGLIVGATTVAGEQATLTDATGNYRLYGFDAGTYTVRSDANTAPSGYVPTTPTSVSAVLPTNTSQFNTADFGLQPGLPPNIDSSIGDMVWVDFNENGVFDTGEEPIDNATVRLYLDLDSSGTITAGDKQVGTQVTDAAGHYLFTGLNAGTYLVAVDQADPDFPAGAVLTGTSPAQPNPETVVLGVQEDKMTVDFAYNYTASIGDLVWYDNNGNGTQDGSENGVVGAQVLLYLDSNGNGVYDGDSDLQVGTALTTAGGAYAFTKLPAGTYFVKVYSQSVAPEGSPDGPYTLLATTDEKITVNLAPAQAYTAADFGFKNGSFFEGTLFWDINHDSVYEPQLSGTPEQPLANITVWIDTDADGVLDWTDGNANNVWDEGEGERWTVTDADGEYKFFVSQVGDYLVRYDITDPDIPVALQGALAPTTPTAQSVRVSVLGEEIEGIDFGRDNVGIVGDLIFGDRGTTGTYNGSITDPGLAGVVVELFIDSDGNGLFDPVNDAYLAATATDSSGNYSFLGLPDGTYFVDVLEASLPLAWQMTATVDPTAPLDGVGKAIVTSGGSVLTMDFGYPPQQPGSIAGTVFNDNGSAVGDGELNAAVIDGFIDINRDGSITSSDDGIFLGFSIIDGKVDVDGSGTVDVADDIADASFDGKNVIDGLVDFNGGGISTADDGTLSADSRLAGVTINLYDGSGALVASTVTDANGNYRFDGLRPGAYTVEEVNATGYDDTLDRAGLAANEATNINTTDDLIPVSVTAGAVSANNNFLDDSDSAVYLVALSGQVRNDTDVDGDLADSETGISNVTIRLFKDLNGDGATALLAVIDGKIDINGDGVISATDTGTLFGLPIIGGQVDVNNDGAITIADDLTNFNGVAVFDGLLDIVPSGVAAADDGTIGTEPLIATTLTNGSGNYSFADLSFGDYVVVETDPAGAFSTADVVAANDNQVAVTLSYGGETGRDFLDSLTGTVSGHLYADTNGNGVQDGVEPNLVGVDVLIEDSTGRLITATSDASGNWTATVPPGTTKATVVITDPQFLAVFPADYVQTDGTNPTTVVAVANATTSMGNDGYFNPYTTTNPASLVGTVYNDVGTAGFGGGDIPVAGVVVDLYLDTNNDHLVPFFSVIDGQIDLNGGGISATDDGFVLDYAIIDGSIDIDGNGLINASDDGTFNGLAVIDGKLDIVPGGGITVADDGTIAGEPLIAQDVTTSAGTYGFTNLPATSYVVIEHNPAGSTSVDDRAAGTEFEGATTDNQIGVVLSASENSTGNDFLDIGVVTYVVSGTVFNDTDATNGFSGGDTPIATVTVAIYADFNTDGILSPEELAVGPIATTTTSFTGTYSFTGLPAGNYVVRETDPAGATSVTDADAPAPNGANEIGVVITNANITGRNFLDTGYPPASISGVVLADADNDNNGDTGIINVTLTLYSDSNGDGNPDGVALGTAVTDTNGAYTFSNLPPGSYVVVETQPAGYLTVTDADTTSDAGGSPADVSNSSATDNSIPVNLAIGETDSGNSFVEEQPAVISGFVLADTNNDNTGDTGIGGVLVTLKDSSGNDIDSDLLTGDVQPTTATTIGNGSYSFGNLPPGSYRVVETQPAGYLSVSDVDGGNLNIIGDVTLITATAGATTANQNFVEISTCPDTWADWKQLHPTETAAGNPDADAYDNFAEFAFAMPNDSGVPSKWLPSGTAWIIRPSTLAPGTLEGVFVRPTGATLNVTYTLQYAPPLGSLPGWLPGSPPGWLTKVIDLSNATWTSNGDCTETVVIPDLAGLTGYPGGGIVRIKADLDEVPGSGTDHTSYTDTEGWKKTTLGALCRTYNNPFQQETVFSGTVAGVDGQVLTFTGETLNTLLISGQPYYLEVTSGDNEGHRFDIVSVSGNSVTLVNDSNLYAVDAPFSTWVGVLPTNLAGDKIAIHRHRTLDEQFSPLGIGKAADRNSADQVKLLIAGQWVMYWNYDGVATANPPTIPVTPRWVAFGDTNFLNKGATVIPPGQGLFFDNRHVATSVLAYGEVRNNDFIRPIALGTSLVGGGYPLDQSAIGTGSRQMTYSATPGSSFFGSRDLATADSFYVWKGDAVAGTNGYDSYFLNVFGTNPEKWVIIGDSGLASRNAEKIILGDSSISIRAKASIDRYTITNPWTP